MKELKGIPASVSKVFSLVHLDTDNGPKFCLLTKGPGPRQVTQFVDGKTLVSVAQDIDSGDSVTITLNPYIRKRGLVLRLFGKPYKKRAGRKSKPNS